MQNRYAGDVGDFGKFGLLRHLLNNSPYTLAINWYLFPDENHNQDGQYTGYLKNAEYRMCDPELHDRLAKVVASIRNVQALENAGILSSSTLYYSDIADFYIDHPANTKDDRLIRKSRRNSWKNKAITTLSTADFLFLDPDNGLEIKSCPTTSRKKSAKYAYYDEINEFHQGMYTTIIYHHLNRNRNHGDHKSQIIDRSSEIKARVDNADTVFGIRYRPYSPRAFFIISRKDTTEYVRKRLSNFLDSNWSHFWDSLTIC